MYHIWRLEALARLKENLRKKWLDDLPNLNLFIERLEKRDRSINPCFFIDDSESYDEDSESYFEKVFLWKIEKEEFLTQTRHFIRQRRHKKVYGKALRKPIRRFFIFQNLVYYKNINTFEKYEDFFPKKVYRCPCVLSAVKHCFENGERSLGEILESLKSFDYSEPFLSSEIFCTNVGNEKE